MASLALTVDGQSLTATLTPPPPAPSVSAAATWDTTTVADGSHTLGATATDQAGTTASTTRVVIKVGVAYGTDPERVHALLLEAARANPLVLAEPEPISLFQAFGASTLDFELRVFVGAVVDRLVVQSQLNMAVARLFAEHGVEIAFPQLDLHIRDVPRSAV